MTDILTPEMLLNAYSVGIFPMAVSRESNEIQWIDPHDRGVIPLDGFHISRSLRKTIGAARYQATFNQSFEAVVQACADRQETWINPVIHDLYLKLHQMGYAHSQEIWDQDQMIGGVYGVALGGAFFGESMFSHRRDGSKIALAWLIDRLRRTGFQLFDTQFLTRHLESLGALEISRQDYHDRLGTALISQADIKAIGKQTAQDVIQRNTHTSYRE